MQDNLELLSKVLLIVCTAIVTLFINPLFKFLSDLIASSFKKENDDTSNPICVNSSLVTKLEDLGNRLVKLENDYVYLKESISGITENVEDISDELSDKVNNTEFMKFKEDMNRFQLDCNKQFNTIIEKISATDAKVTMLCDLFLKKN